MIKWVFGPVKTSSVATVDRHYDDRGFFQEIFNHTMQSMDVQQVNWSTSNKNVLRGIHVAPYAKLVTCVSGSIYDVVVDLRRGSESYLQWWGKILDENSPDQMYVPKGCGHAFWTMTDNTKVVYLQDGVYSPSSEYTMRWNDPLVGIKWPFVGDPILSSKDAQAVFWAK
jgi:dTDP-4-dehydrorhamnose 3,5-epimerase